MKKPKIVVIALSDVGLLSVDDAAAALDRDEKTVRRWIVQGLLPVVVVGSGNRATYLLRQRDVTRFKLPERGPKSKHKRPSATAEK